MQVNDNQQQTVCAKKTKKIGERIYKNIYSRQGAQRKF